MARGITNPGFIITQWKVGPEARLEHDKAVEALMIHTEKTHPRVRGNMCLRYGLDEFIHIAYVGSLSKIEEIARLEETPECEAVWEAVRRHMVPGSMTTNFWSDVAASHWKPFAPLGGAKSE